MCSVTWTETKPRQQRRGVGKKSPSWRQPLARGGVGRGEGETDCVGAGVSGKGPESLHLGWRCLAGSRVCAPWSARQHGFQGAWAPPSGLPGGIASCPLCTCFPGPVCWGSLLLLLDALWPKTLLLSFHNTFLKLHFFCRMAVPHWKVFLKGNGALERELSCVPCFLSHIFFGIE